MTVRLRTATLSHQFPRTGSKVLTMTSLQKIAVGALLVLLALIGYGLWYTTPCAAARQAARQAREKALVDDSVLQTAQKLAPLARSADEQALAQSAVRMADRELDLAF